MMGLKEIIAELEGCARWEANGIAALETTRFEPELDAIAQPTILASKRRAEALAVAIRLLRNPIVAQFPGIRPEGAR